MEPLTKFKTGIVPIISANAIRIMSALLAQLVIYFIYMVIDIKHSVKGSTWGDFGNAFLTGVRQSVGVGWPIWIAGFVVIGVVVIWWTDLTLKNNLRLAAALRVYR